MSTARKVPSGASPARATPSRGAAWALFAALGAQACASGPGGPPAAPRTTAVTPSRPAIEADHLVVTADEAIDVPELLLRADASLEAGRNGDALADYQRVIQAERLRGAGARAPAERSWLVRAWFGAGTAHDMLGDRLAALEHYRRVYEEFPEASLAPSAGVRCVRLLVHLERVTEAAALARGILDAGARAGGRNTARANAARSNVARANDGLGPLERVALFGALALDAVARDDDVGALRFVARGRQIVDVEGFDRSGTIPRDLAQLYFALGEVRRLRAERLRFDTPPAEFPARLEQRCQLLLDAQSAYSDAMRAHDAHWSAMAGFRVGELYQKLHEDVMRVPPPDTADDEESRALFEGAMRLRYSILLRKARTMLDHTLAMVQRTGHSTPWAEKSRAARERILRALDEEEAALDRLPHSRRELEAALEALRERGAVQPAPGAASDDPPGPPPPPSGGKP